MTRRLVLDHRPCRRPGCGRLSLDRRAPAYAGLLRSYRWPRPRSPSGSRLALGGRHIDSTISFHRRDLRTAAVPVQGLLHTCQAIPENLLFANLGLTVQTTASPGRLAHPRVFLAWSSRAWFRRRREEGTRWFGPLELTGAALVLDRLHRRVDISWIHGLSIPAHASTSS